MKVRLDSDLRRNNQGTALIGGSPTRLLRLSVAGARLLDTWAAGSAVGDGGAEAKLLDRLLDAGVVHPIVEPELGRSDDAGLGVVIPVLDDAAGLSATLESVRRELPDVAIVVVDDGSVDDAAIAQTASASNASVVRHDVNMGPAAARNTGWQSLANELADGSLIAFIDADVLVEPGALTALTSHFEFRRTAAVAPRVQSASGVSLIARYEAARSPLDLGSRPARVRAGSRVSYVPSAALVVRLSVLRELDGFAEAMRSGEDVDFVWRVDQAGWHVRYEPNAVVRHRNRATLSELARQRRTYGSAAADLADRHPGDVAPVSASAPMFAIWASIIFGGLLGKVVAGGGAAAMALHLRRLLASHSEEPIVDAIRMSGRSHATLARWLATASMRAWLPLLMAASLVSSRSRRWLVASVVGPSVADWVKHRPAIDPARFVALGLFDDAAYCAGVVKGVVKRRSIAALLPRFLPSGLRPHKHQAA